jgi:hypothetical protein
LHPCIEATTEIVSSTTLQNTPLMPLTLLPRERSSIHVAHIIACVIVRRHFFHQYREKVQRVEDIRESEVRQ